MQRAPISPNHKNAWQEALLNLITDPQELLNILELDLSLLPAAIAAADAFPLKVPRGFVARMEKGNINDPLLRQVLPLGIELTKIAGYVDDPLAESNVNPVPGLLHKYHGRVLITLTSTCAVHCRYCFRRHFPYAENNPGTKGWEKMFAYISQDESITEVILSGGDPLAVSDKLLAHFLQGLKWIPHVKRLRIHSRIPVVLPERLTPELIALLTTLPLEVVLVVHVNHANEISVDVKAALSQLRAAGIHLLNQAVLLRGVNDTSACLIALSEALFAAGVLPYYLHVLDKVAGAAHFDMDLREARQLHAAMTAKLPGYLVPRLAVEEVGAHAKTILSTALYTG